MVETVSFERLPCAFGRYRILERIAAGGMGAVYLAAEPRETGSRHVAIKILHPHHREEDSEIQRRFIDEARIVERIVHPNVVTLFDSGELHQVAYLALEYIEGTTLSALMKAARSRGERLPFGVVVSILVDALAGLQAAHEAVTDEGDSMGVVHRDVSPQNILVSVDGHAYITDFGVAKTKDRIRATRTGTLIGKAGYMAPEQILARPVTLAADLYAAGIILWECLVGGKLFHGFEAQMRAATTQAKPPRPSELDPTIPPAYDELLDRLLAYDPAQRPSSALEVVLALRALAEPASREEVATWVAPLRREAARRELPTRPETDPSTIVDITPTEPGMPDVLVASTPMLRRPASRRGAWIGLGVLGVGLGLLAATTQHAHSAVEWRTKLQADAGPDRTPALLDTAPNDDASDAAASAFATDAGESGVDAGSQNDRFRLRRRQTKPSCTPPFTVVDGVRRYKPECFKRGP